MKKLTLLFSLFALLACKKEEKKPVYKIIVRAYAEHYPYGLKVNVDGQRENEISEEVNTNTFYREIEFSPEDDTDGAEISVGSIGLYDKDSMYVSIECNGVFDENAKRFYKTKLTSLEAEITLPKQ
jgi:hypothetical protein